MNFPLLFATGRRRSLNFVRFLVEPDASAMTVDNNRSTPLHLTQKRKAWSSPTEHGAKFNTDWP
jgi:hypothetical protein